MTATTQERYDGLEDVLERLSLSHYLPLLREANIDAAKLLSASDRELGRLGIACLGHRRSILDVSRAIREEEQRVRKEAEALARNKRGSQARAGKQADATAHGKADGNQASPTVPDPGPTPSVPAVREAPLPLSAPKGPFSGYLPVSPRTPPAPELSKPPVPRPWVAPPPTVPPAAPETPTKPSPDGTPKPLWPGLSATGARSGRVSPTASVPPVVPPSLPPPVVPALATPASTLPNETPRPSGPGWMKRGQVAQPVSAPQPMVRPNLKTPPHPPTAATPAPPLPPPPTNMVKTVVPGWLRHSAAQKPVASTEAAPASPEEANAPPSKTLAPLRPKKPR